MPPSDSQPFFERLDRLLQELAFFPARRGGCVEDDHLAIEVTPRRVLGELCDVVVSVIPYLDDGAPRSGLDFAMTSLDGRTFQSRTDDRGCAAFGYVPLDTYCRLERSQVGVTVDNTIVQVAFTPAILALAAETDGKPQPCYTGDEKFDAMLVIENGEHAIVVFAKNHSVCNAIVSFRYAGKYPVEIRLVDGLGKQAVPAPPEDDELFLEDFQFSLSEGDQT